MSPPTRRVGPRGSGLQRWRLPTPRSAASQRLSARETGCSSQPTTESSTYRTVPTSSSTRFQACWTEFATSRGSRGVCSSTWSQVRTPTRFSHGGRNRNRASHGWRREPRSSNRAGTGQWTTACFRAWERSSSPHARRWPTTTHVQREHLATWSGSTDRCRSLNCVCHFCGSVLSRRRRALSGVLVGARAEDDLIPARHRGAALLARSWLGCSAAHRRVIRREIVERNVDHSDRSGRRMRRTCL